MAKKNSSVVTSQGGKTGKPGPPSAPGAAKQGQGGKSVARKAPSKRGRGAEKAPGQPPGASPDTSANTSSIEILSNSILSEEILVSSAGAAAPPPIPSRGEGPAEAVRSALQAAGAGAEEAAAIEELLRVLQVPRHSRFEPRGEIGRGGTGVVSVLYDRVLHRRTAVKTLLDSFRKNPLIVRAFIREAQITGQLDHPNIVPVHDAGLDEEGRLSFTMKLIEGRTLASILDDEEHEKRTVDQAHEQLWNLLEAVVKVCDALAFAHSRGVIHCDVKAQNIMLGDYGQVYLTDWGFAQLLPPRPQDADAGARDELGRRIADRLPRLRADREGGYVLGTPGYMAPEQARGLMDRLDERTDVFLLGALLYQLVSGDVPFRGETPQQSVLMAQRCEFPALTEQQIGAFNVRPKELVRIINRAMSKEPADRYPSILAMRADLVQFLRGGSNFPARKYPAGAHVLREGEAADAAYILVSGEAEVYKDINGRRVVLQSLRAGDTFGELALLTSSPRFASVVALSEVTVVVVTRELVEQELNSMKPWMGTFIRSFASRFRDQQDQSLRKSVPGAEEPKRWWKFW